MMAGDGPFIHCRGDAYDDAFEARAVVGQDVHGEARLVASLQPRSVLDAGCGTGRVAMELARQGIAVLGVDRDPEMIATARRKAPELTWLVADLATLPAGNLFDVVLLAGNVLLFVDPGSEREVIGALARRLAPGGAFVAGFQLGGRLSLAQYDALAAGAGLLQQERWSTWDRAPWEEDSGYAVSLHRFARGAAAGTIE